MWSGFRAAPEEGEVPDEPEEEAGGDHPLASTTKIDPDEIPPVPGNRFLDRGGGRSDDAGARGGEASGRPARGERHRSDRDRDRRPYPDRERGRPDRDRRHSRGEIRAGKRIKGRGFLVRRHVLCRNGRRC